MTHEDLGGDWQLRAVSSEVPAGLAGLAIPATVPGCVHTDLLAAGHIEDPYLDLNEALLQWIGRVDWRYERRFTAEAADGRADLVFEGLDTVATVELNGRSVAQVQNMHRTHRVDVGELLVAGENLLAVTFESPVRAADRFSEQLGRRPHVNHHPYNAIRKMACNFGWDWGPDLATAGIWKSVRLERWSVARLASVRPLVSLEGGDAVVRVHVEVERAQGVGGDLAVDVRVGDHAARGTIRADAQTTVVEVVVPDPPLWWPHGWGAQPLSDVVVSLAEVDDAVWRGRIGFRSIELRTEPDEAGTGFVLVVNGESVFVKGANWIPDDAFPHRVTRERYATRVRQAREAGVTLLRVWGGGIFEQDDFYDACDEQGVLVWQDFLFACAAYSEEEPMRSEVVAEVRDNVTRLVPHASLAVWNGNNENTWGHVDWDWQQRLGDLSWGSGYYDEILPALVAELDGTRPYTPGSPFSLDPSRHPNDPSDGLMHVWDVWNERDYTVYRDYRPRFVSEFGWQGPPTWATLTRALHDNPLTPESPAVLLHQKATEGNRKLERGLHPHLPQPRGMEDFHWAMQLNQARAVSFGLEHFRALAPHCMGAIVWQLNDCWPVTSWAAVDGDGRKKPLFYAMKHAYAPRLLTVQPAEDGLVVCAVNDSAGAWEGELTLARMALDGEVLARATLPVSAAARSSSVLAVPPALSTPEDPARELLVVSSAEDARALWFFAEDVASALAPAELETHVRRTAHGYVVRVSARSLVKDLVLLADKLDPAAEVEDMLVTLLPGETVELRVRTDVELDPAELVLPHILRSSNQLLHPAAAARHG